MYKDYDVDELFWCNGKGEGFTARGTKEDLEHFNEAYSKINSLIFPLFLTKSQTRNLAKTMGLEVQDK